LGAGLPGGSAKLADYWKMGEAEAAKYGKTLSRDDWRLVVNMHCAETDELAIEEVRRGERIETIGYFGETLGMPPMRSENPLAEGLARTFPRVKSLCVSAYAASAASIPLYRRR
jgi:limonene 1,2-monooxygenase